MPLSKREQRILRSIVVASENDPNKPEFPPDNPYWPSTPVKRITVPGFCDVYLKEELREPRNYFSVLKAIAQGKTKFSGIANEVGLEKNALHNYLFVYGTKNQKYYKIFK